MVAILLKVNENRKLCEVIVSYMAFIYIVARSFYYEAVEIFI